MKKQAVFKGNIKAVADEIHEIATKYKGWTVADYIWLARIKKYVFDDKQKNF